MNKDLKPGYRYIKCNLCGGDRQTVYAVNDSEDKYILHRIRVRCPKCGLVYSNPQATEEKMAEFYSQAYPEMLGAIDIIDDETFFLDPPCSGRKQMKPGRFLDVGCAYGFRVKTAQRLGWEAYGVEVSTQFCDYARNTLGLRHIFNGALFEAHHLSSFFDYIILWHVLEHVPDPARLLKEIERILKPGGILLIGVPNIGEPLYQVSRAGCWLKRKPYGMATTDHHTYEFTPATLRHAIKKNCPSFKINNLKVFYSDKEMELLGGESANLKQRAVVNISKFLSRILRDRVGSLISMTCIKGNENSDFTCGGNL